jgi:hypothetical protein
MANHSWLKEIKPTLTLMGSVPEGTRIGNEVDLMLEFKGFKKSPFKVKGGHPFHLIASDCIPECMKQYLKAEIGLFFISLCKTYSRL